MATYLKNQGVNNLEGRQGTSVFGLGPIAVTADRTEGDTMYADGDLILVGSLPKESITNDIRVLIHEGFDAGTTIDYGFASYTDGVLTGITAISTGIKVETANNQAVLPMPVTGNVNPDGTAYAGDAAGIWAGEGDVAMVVKVNATGAITKGEISILNSHSYFGTRQGGYIA